ncbi:hypothetical protein DPMN_121818 [Dreissena polymorpha]|uniref:Uncharacterized protein n=1 Tax=Dreissena polymorpha TaxID=45954 RepID=A0A9D4GMU2_DREPO|nr:hypothetical protein DPMN_121818 [Dreissena polymorpha]
MLKLAQTNQPTNRPTNRQVKNNMSPTTIMCDKFLAQGNSSASILLLDHRSHILTMFNQDCVINVAFRGVGTGDGLGEEITGIKNVTKRPAQSTYAVTNRPSQSIKTTNSTKSTVTNRPAQLTYTVTNRPAQSTYTMTNRPVQST